MNNEIKAIIEYFKDDIDYLEEELKYPNFKGKYITIRGKECEYLRKLLDYITNLQEKVEQYENPDDLTLFYMWLDEKAKNKMKKLEEENERLKELCNKYEEEHSKEFKIWKDERQQLLDYKSRIDKAIEYVNTHKPSDTISFPLMKKDEENQVKSCFDYEFREIYQKELLEILQGNKWNEVERAYLDDKPIGSEKE